MNSNKIFGIGFAHYQGEQNYFNDLIHTALSNGVTYFEACSFYNNYLCELQLAESLNRYTDREKILLGNKLSLPCLAAFENNLELYFEDQLNRCNTTYFDYYFIQYIDYRYFNEDKTPNELFVNQYNFLQEKKKEGKIKNIGFIFHWLPDYFENCFLNFDWDCVQFSLNYYKWKYGYAKDLYKIATNYNVPIIAMEPLAMGLFTDSEKIRQASYNFLMTLSNVKIILSGATNPIHLYDNQKILLSYLQFSKNDLDLLNSVLNNLYYDCTNCDKCLIHCPKGIDLKQLITNFNNKSSQEENKEKYYKYFEPFLKENNTFCRSCDLCSTQCRNQHDFQQLFWNEIFPLRI